MIAALLAGIAGSVILVLVCADAARRKRAVPDMPWALCIFSTLLSVPRSLGLPPYSRGGHSFDAAVQRAVRNTGLHDLGHAKERFVQTYGDMYATEYMTRRPLRELFSPTGELGADSVMQNIVERRLRMAEFMRTHPEVRDIQVKRPIFVMGLPRTGTTFTHRLLALEPTARPALTWELMKPIPYTQPGCSAEELAADLEERHTAAKQLMSVVQTIFGDMMAHVHEIGADIPEECTVFLTNDIPMSAHLLPSLFVNHRQWMGDKVDMRHALENYADCLRILQYQRPDIVDQEYWVLKCPVHMAYIDAIEAVFPDAILVWTHRTPTSAVPSVASLLRTLQNIYFHPRDWDAAAMGGACLDYSETVINKAMHDIQHTKLRHAHVMYDELVKDPVATCRKLYDNIGIEFTPGMLHRLETHLAEDAAKRASLKGRKKTLHGYKPEDYGLTGDQIRTRLNEYVRTFGL